MTETDLTPLRPMKEYSYTLAFDKTKPDEVRKTIQRMTEMLVGMTVACGAPKGLHWDYHDFANKKNRVKRPSGMKLRHNALLRWTGEFDQESIERVRNS